MALRGEADPETHPAGWARLEISFGVEHIPCGAASSMIPTGASSMRELCLGERRASREIPPSQPAQVKAG